MEIEAGLTKGESALKKSNQVLQFFESVRVAAINSNLADTLKPGLPCSAVRLSLGEPEEQQRDGLKTRLTYRIPKVEDDPKRVISADFECSASLIRASIEYASGRSDSLASVRR